MKVKVCLVGEHAVGKTSLIKRYVLNEYDDRYIVTLGAKVSKKELALNPQGSDAVQMDMTIWDIMGSKGFRELLREAYFHGAQGILAVADITRYDTLEDLDSWVESVFRTVGEIPVTVRNQQDGPQGPGGVRRGTGEAGDGSVRCAVLLQLREDGRQRGARLPHARRDDCENRFEVRLVTWTDISLHRSSERLLSLKRRHSLK